MHIHLQYMAAGGGGGAGFRPRYFCLGLLAINRRKGVISPVDFD